VGKRDIHVTSLPFNGKRGENCLRISVAYEEGGRNIYSGENDRKGFYAHVTPANEYGGETGCPSIRFTLGARLKCFLEKATRFNAKKLEKLAEACMDRADVKKCVEAVSRTYGMEGQEAR
jgi:hypothetical protein